MQTVKQGEIFATGLVRPRTTALFFDKLWVPSEFMDFKLHGINEPIPSEFCVQNPLGEIKFAICYLANVYGIDAYSWIKLYVSDDVSLNYRMGPITEQAPDFKEILHKIFQNLPNRNEPNLPNGYEIVWDKEIPVKFRNEAIHDIVKMYAKKGIKLTPIYLKPSHYDEVSSKSEVGVEICLNFVPTILESKLTWDQVSEIRKDKEARKKLDRLRRWFSLELLEKSEEEIKNILGRKLDDYEWALKKHGIKTTVGGATSIISFAGGSAALNSLSTSPLAVFGGGIMLMTGASAWIIKRLIERKDIERDEISYIYDVRQLS